VSPSYSSRQEYRLEVLDRLPHSARSRSQGFNAKDDFFASHSPR
jgi:hypothetical protein